MGQAGECRIQSPTGDEQQGEAGTDLLIVDANGAIFVEGHGSSSLYSLLRKYTLRVVASTSILRCLASYMHSEYSSFISITILPVALCAARCLRASFNSSNFNGITLSKSNTTSENYGNDFLMR